MATVGGAIVTAEIVRACVAARVFGATRCAEYYPTRQAIAFPFCDHSPRRGSAITWQMHLEATTTVTAIFKPKVLELMLAPGQRLSGKFNVTPYIIYSNTFRTQIFGKVSEVSKCYNATQFNIIEGTVVSRHVRAYQV